MGLRMIFKFRKDFQQVKIRGARITRRKKGKMIATKDKQLGERNKSSRKEVKQPHSRDKEVGPKRVLRQGDGGTQKARATKN